LEDEMSEMVTIVLPPDTWYRGLGGDDSQLLRQDGRQCCLGVACTFWGVADEDLEQATTLDSVSEILPLTLARFNGVRYPTESALPDAIKAMMPPVVFNKDATPPQVAELAYYVNDAEELEDGERIRLLNLLTEPYGFRFELGTVESA
jgi:hypothetical protein